MDEREAKPDEELQVNDRRRFTQDGEARATAETAETPPSSTKDVPHPEGARETKNGEAKELPPIDFMTFLLSLATSAQIHLGAIPNPSTGKQECDLALARQTIDLLGILEEKTKGNLTEQEGRLMTQLLFDVRMMFVQAGKGK